MCAKERIAKYTPRSEYLFIEDHRIVEETGKRVSGMAELKNKKNSKRASHSLSFQCLEGQASLTSSTAHCGQTPLTSGVSHFIFHWC